MIDINKKYSTRDGREVRIYATDGGVYWPIHGAIQLSCSGWVTVSWDKHGNSCNSFHRDDLIEVRPRHKRMVWLNVSAHNGAIGYETKELADEWEKLANHRRIACIKVELDFEEGEGL